MGNLDQVSKQKLQLQEMAWKQNINTAYSSSMGRLFDAAASLLDICHYNSYEGECAIQLEQAAHMGKAEMEGLSREEAATFGKLIKINYVKIDDCWQVDSIKLLVDLYHLKKDFSKEILAYLFHKAVANAIVENADNICRDQDVEQIALSGGTFINRILLIEVIKRLEVKNKKVYTNEKVPCGDGGIALGQMYLATFFK